jgi:hypothetical protein
MIYLIHKTMYVLYFQVSISFFSIKFSLCGAVAYALCCILISKHHSVVLILRTDSGRKHSAMLNVMCIAIYLKHEAYTLT